MKKLLVIFILFYALYTQGQDQNPYENMSKNVNDKDFHSMADIGVGIGLNYGGLMGGQIQYVPLNHLALFASVGYYMIGLGWQVGVNGYIMPKIPSKSFRVYGTAMYGTHSVIVIEGGGNYNKIYVGPTIGAGIEMRFGKLKKNGLNVDLFIPIRSSEYQDDMTRIKNDPYIEDLTEPLPLAITVGYHFEIR